MDSLVDGLEKNYKAMFSISLSEKGKVIYSRASGDRDWSKKLKANTQTTYHIGSITKMFTAVMILQLVEENKMTLDTKLSNYFPTLPKADKITIQQLLNHTSGLHNFTNDSSYATYNEQPKTEKDLIDLFSKQAPDFEPGEGHEYSNTAYVVLSLILEKITNKGYNELLQERIGKKIGLKNTHVIDKINTAENMAQSYTRNGTEWVKETETHMSIPRGAGAISSTPEDLNTFITALFSNQLLKKESLDKMTEIKNGNGLGIFQFPFGGHKAFGHTGGIDGFHSMLGYFPENGKSIAVVCNGLDYNLNQMMIGFLSIWYEVPYKLPVWEKKEWPMAELQKRCGTFKEKKSGFGIHLFEKDKKLYAQGDGQGEFELEITGKDECRNETFGVRMVFNMGEPTYPSFTLFQNGMEMLFERSKEK